MIEPTDAVFPNNVVTLLVDRLPSIDPELMILRRPLAPSDPVQCVGVFATMWNPVESSYEIGGTPSRYAQEPTLSTYTVTVQALVKDYDVERALAVQSIFGKAIRGMLYRDAPLRVAFGMLEVSMYGSTERFKRWGIRQQRFVGNEIQGEHVFLSSLDLWIETETV